MMADSSCPMKKPRLAEHETFHRNHESAMMETPQHRKQSMSKKLLLPVLVSLMFALPATAQEEGWQPEPGPSIPEMAMKVFRFVGGIVSAGTPVETDEMVQDQSPEKAVQPAQAAKKKESSPSQQVTVDAKPVEAPVKADASAQPVTSETAQDEGKTAPVPVKAPAEEQPTVAVPEKHSSVAPSEQPQVEKQKAERPKKGRRAKRGKNGKEQPVTQPTETKKAYPEITVSTYRDTLPADMPSAEVQEKALAGNPEAQYRMGLKCYNGDGFVQDSDKAFGWWQASAGQGYPKAQHLMGVAYRKGIGTLKNAEKALSWFTKAAQQGRAVDQYIVADAYYDGKVNNIKDDGLAVYWANHAAAQGHPGALVLLAQAKLEGRGVLPNIIHAYVLAKKAQELDGHADVVVEDIEKSMTEEQLRIAETLTLEDALKPISQTSLVLQKEMEARTSGKTQGKAPEQVSEKVQNPSTQTESSDND